MNILVTLNNFDYLSGSPVFNYELAKGLVEKGHDVTIKSPSVGGVLQEKALQARMSFQDKPNYDLWISNQSDYTNALQGYIKANKHFHLIHSEFGCENPNVQADKFFGIRPSICKKYAQLKPILLWNPVDNSRFNTHDTTDEGFILFVGTVDHMRKQAFLETCRIAKEKGLKVKLVGKMFTDWGALPENAEYEADRWNIEDLTKRCTETAGIMYGRTTIEGWMCGKPGHFWEVGDSGNLLAYNYLQAYNVDISKHFTLNVVDELLKYVELC